MTVPRTIVIEQPNYLPWIGYFDLMRQSDVWVWYDDVQYTKRDWRNRNRVGLDEALWLTVPVQTRGRFHQHISEVEIAYEQPWVRRHLETIRRCYARAPHFEQVWSILAPALEAQPRMLADLAIAINESIAAMLGIAPRFARSSQLGGGRFTRQERLIEICGRFEATSYLSGPAARAYIDPRAFASAGLELRYICYDYPPYRRGAHPFVPNLSIVDALAWMGAEDTAAFLETHARSESEVVA